MACSYIFRLTTFFIFRILSTKVLPHFCRSTKIKNVACYLHTTFYILLSGERGIQTPGTLQYGGFQDRCNRSLCHLSRDRLFFKGGAKIKLFPELPNRGALFNQ